VLPDPVLTALAVELGTGGPGIADIIAPVATVTNDLFKYTVWGREKIKDDVRTERAPGVGANEVKFSQTWKEASVKNHALKDKIPDEMRNNAPPNAGLEEHATMVLTGKLKLGNETRVAALLTGASKTQTAPSTKWDAASGSTIRKDVLTAKEVFRRQAGMYPNVMVVPPSVATVMKNDSQILELLKYTRGNLIEDGTIPRFEGMTFLEPGMIKDTSNPGATAQIADIYNSDEVYYLYVAPNAGNDLKAMTALRQVRSTATAGQPFATLKYRDPEPSAWSDWVSVSCNQLELTIADELILRHLDVLT
jgi:hypothetical protein